MNRQDMRLFASIFYFTSVHANPALTFCSVGWSFEKSCLGISYPTAYMDGKPGQPAQCVIALENNQATASQINFVCETIKDKNGVSAVPWDSTTASVTQLEKYFAIKQTGKYIAAQGREVIPTSGKKSSIVGYLCVLKDDYGCDGGSYRYESYCYYPIAEPQIYDDAVEYCEIMNLGSLPRITNDEENKFVALLAREKIFNNTLAKNEIWGPLYYSDFDQMWVYWNTNSIAEKRVHYMRWWSGNTGTDTVTKKPAQGYKASTIFTGQNDKDRIAYFGYWGTAKNTEKKPYICRRSLQKVV